MKFLGLEITRARDVAASEAAAPIGHNGGPPLEAEARSLENPSVSLADTQALSMLGIGENAGPNIVVTPNSALGVSAVYACVFYIAKTVGWLPVHVLQKDGRRTIIATDVPIYAVLATKPNSYQTPFIFKMQMFAQMLLWGNAYAEIQRDRRTGEVLGLYPIPAWEVEPRLENGVKTFRVRGMTFANEDVFHIMAPGFDGVRGLSPIRQHRMTVGMAMEALAYGEQFYRNGTKLAGALSHPGKLGDEAQARLRNSWGSAYAGKANSGKVAILEEGMTFNPFTMPMEDAQYIETRKFSVSEIARIYGVPPHKIGDLEKATFSNIEQQAIETVNDCLMPPMVGFEQEANGKLLTERQRQQGYAVKHNVKALLRGDIKAQMEAIKLGREAGLYSVNDGLELLDMNPVDSDGGDERIRPMNFVPIGTPASGSKLNDPLPNDHGDIAPAKEPTE
jgi:HK97 family phage portal protein